MENHSALSDSAFLQQFQQCTLAPALFTHEAHLRLAWLYIRSYGALLASEILCNHIQQFATHNEAPNKFNRTLTVAATKAVYHFMLKSTSKTFDGFRMEFPQLQYDFRALMAAHYSFDIYQNPKAKTQYLHPDLLPFDY